MGVEDGLHLCLGGIELGKQRLNARNKALLLGERGQCDWVCLHIARLCSHE